MQRRPLTSLAVPLLVGMAFGMTSLSATAQQPEREGIGERIGEQLDRGLKDLTSELRQGWAEVRRSVEKLGVEGRVYSRLHWDKSLTSAELEIDVEDEGVVILTGTVPDAAARRKALQLAEDTVGVQQVVDRLTLTTAANR